ncbi:MAG: hypothetical protein N2235_08430 [Fischerella sp.]|nr:hypothetical protein [Fischerella sp.]
MSETFKVGGVSRLNGQVKVRFANDLTRVKNLAKSGHTDIELLELPSAMTKAEVVKHLMTTDLYKNPEYQAVIDAADAKYNAAPKQPRIKAEKTAKVTKARGKPSLDAIKARANKKAAAPVAEAQDPATPQESFQAAVDAVGDEAPF